MPAGAAAIASSSAGAQDRLALEQHFALVRKIAEKGALSDTRFRGDLRGRGLFVTLVVKQRQRSLLLQSRARIGFGSAQSNLLLSVTDIKSILNSRCQ